MADIDVSGINADRELIDAVGLIANELIDSIPKEETGTAERQQSLLERALIYAARMQRENAEKDARIAVLSNLSFKDDQTGLSNRRGFMSELGRTLAMANRFGYSGMLLYFDLDNLKCINDRFGHAAGDRLIRAAANSLRHAVRSFDTVGRMGGDEFAVILSQIPAEEGSRLGDRIHKALEGTSVDWNGESFNVRASMGMQPFGPDDSASDILSRADAKMYRDKKNRHQPDTSVPLRAVS